MKTTIFPYDIFNLFNPWPNDLFSWWNNAYINDLAVDYAENPFDYRIEIETPGLRKKDLKITVQDSVLTVKGSRKESSGKWLQKNNLYPQEFQRNFEIPSSVDESQLKAKFTDGRLIITLPKKKEFINYREIPVEGTSKTRVLDYSKKENWLNKAGNRFKTLFGKAA